MDSGSGTVDLREYGSILFRRRWVVLLALLAVSLAALIGSFVTTPLYRATATLHIERKNPDILDFRDLGQSDHSWTAYDDFYRTQYRILGSPAVARRAAIRLDLTSHPDFEAGEPSTGLLSRLTSLIPRRESGVEIDPLDVATARVLGGLEITPIRNSQLVEISWVSPVPELAAQVANAVTAAYVEFNIESQYSTTDQAEEFLVDQIGNLKREIEAIEARLQEYGEAKRIVSIDDSSNITLRALQETASRRTAAQTKLAEAEAALQASMDTPPDALPEAMRSDLIARLRQEYAAYEAEFSEKSRRFKDGWPGMQTLQSKLGQARERLDLEIELIAEQVRAAAKADYDESLAELNNFERLLKEQENAAQRLKRDAVEFANLQSEVQKKRETLSALMRRQTEMALSSRLKDLDTTSTNIRIVEPARVPAAPFRPRIKLNLMLGLVLGLGLGVAVAFLLDYVDNTINSPAELARVISLPLLAIVPRHGSPGPGSLRARRRGPIAPARPFDFVADRETHAEATEAYRELRTSILLSSPGRAPRRLMITSALPEEGKTATSINLAAVLAQLGRRVLVVDTDLRRPRLHKAFDVDNARGVSTFLSGLEDDVSTLVVSTGVEHLDLLPSGPIPPNPSELLNSTRFKELGDQLLARGYQHVIFDSPPALSVSDAVVTASVMDGSILVVRAGRSPRQSIRLAAEKLGQAGIVLLGAVLNDLDSEARGSSYYRYRYYGRYGQAGAEPQAGEGSRAGGAGA